MRAGRGRGKGRGGRAVALASALVAGTAVGCAAQAGDGEPGDPADAVEPLAFEQLDYGYPVHTALADPRIAYIDQGSGPETVVLIHGLASNLGFWRYTIPALAERYRVIALDLPGYGRSDKDDGYAYSMDFFADAVVGLIRELGLEDVTLVGHSMGGQVAMVTALDHPDAVDRLVLADPAGIEAFTAAEGAAIRSVYSVQGIRATPPAAIRANIAANFHAFDEERLGWMVEERRRLAATDEFDRFAHAVVASVGGMLDRPTAPRLEEIRHPTLLVYGARDALIPNRYLHPGLDTDGVFGEGARRIPDATLVPIPDAGHLVMMERPGAFNAAVLEWLQRR